MAEEDRLAIVTYDDQVHVPFPSQPVVQKDAVRLLVDGITAGGTTNLSGGLATGMQQTCRTRGRGGSAACCS